MSGTTQLTTVRKAAIGIGDFGFNL
ncbi:MAG: hypothetical protein JWP92_536, partial [Caulobacter sp.]|nr:hypothetical protein [Caulobacter sp.]